MNFELESIVTDRCMQIIFMSRRLVNFHDGLQCCGIVSNLDVKGVM